MKWLLQIMGLWVLLIGCAQAQTLDNIHLPPPPPSGLLDENGVLARNTELQAQIIRQLKTLENDHGYRLYVVLERSLLTSITPSNYAAQLLAAWAPDGDGMVVVYESDTGRFAFGRDLDSNTGMMPDEVGVPAYGFIDIIANTFRSVRVNSEPEVFIDELVTNLCESLTSYFEKKKSPVDRSEYLRLILVFIGALCLMALGGLGTGWLLKRVDKKHSRMRVFPPIDQPERLGASYGGGGGRTHYFGTRAKR